MIIIGKWGLMEGMIYSFSFFTGNLTVTRVPLPGTGSKVMVPLWSATIRDEMDNPRPVPP
jgi:hypothetical protein